MRSVLRATDRAEDPSMTASLQKRQNEEIMCVTHSFAFYQLFHQYVCHMSCHVYHYPTKKLPVQALTLVKPD